MNPFIAEESLHGTWTYFLDAWGATVRRTQNCFFEEKFCSLPTGISLCYADIGAGSPILLITGLGFQMVHWNLKYIEEFLRRGYRVILFDNSDSGRSSRVFGDGPNFLEKLRTQAPRNPYDLDDMANDAVFLLDSLGIESAHVVGMSMGGMIAQNMAATYSDRVRSLTSIFSTTGSRKVGQPSLKTKLMFLKNPPQSRRESMQLSRDFQEHISGTRFASSDFSRLRTAALAWDRGGGVENANGALRQIGAFWKSGDRTALISKIVKPTLVIHGDRDPLVNPSGGVATAHLIRDAKLKIVEGMGHELSSDLATKMVMMINEHTSSADVV